MNSKPPIVRRPPPGCFIDVLGYKIHYEKVGHGDHVLFLTPGGMGSTRTNFDAQLEKLDRNKFTIIAWDPPGYGYSIPPERSFPKRYIIRDVEIAEEFLRLMGVTKMSIFGWCQGGGTAIFLAARNPQMVTKLILLGSKAFIGAEDKKLIDEFRSIEVFPPELLNSNLSVYEEKYFKKHWEKMMDAMTTVFEEEDGNICKEEVKLVQCPTLVLQGAKDKWILQHHPDYFVKNIKNSRYVELSGGHNTHLQYPEEANLVIEEFLLEDTM